MNYSNYDTNINNDEALIDAYIGKNANKLKNKIFSFNTLFFGYIYFLYRKLWLYSLIWIAGSFIFSSMFPNLKIYLFLIINIIMSFLFKKIYLQHVEKEVSKIKNYNSDKPIEQLIFICYQNGGTNIFPVLFFLIIYSIFIFIKVIFFIFS